MSNLQAAFQSLSENWQRAALSALGVAVASIAVLLLVSIGLGVEKDIRSQVDDLGVNILVAVPGRVALGMGFNPNLAGQSYFTEDQVQAVRQVPGILRAGMLTFAGGGVRRKGQDAYPMVIACTPDWFAIRPVTLQSGRTFDAGTESQAVVVLGQTAKETLFGPSEAVGQTVEINGAPYTVVGVTAEKLAGQSLFAMQGFQNVAYIPYRHLKSVAPNVQIDRIVMRASADFEPKSLVGRVEGVLARTLDRQQFSVLTQEDLLGLIYQMVRILATLVVGLTSIGLFVGGTGIMTVMLMSVNERRKEIGVRKAVGAQRRDVFVQFLAESALIGLGGVTAGLAVSVLVCSLLSAYTSIKPLLTWGTVVMDIAMGLGLGCFFGLLPAVRAAKQDPVVALRME